MLKAKCGTCGAKYEYDEEDAGQEITCECGLRIRLERPLKPCIRCHTKVQDLERGYCLGCREKLAAEKAEIEAAARASAERERELQARMERDRQEMRLREERRRAQPCANCGIPFGKLEQVFNWQGQNVCQLCLKKLQPPAEPPPMPTHRPASVRAGEVICPNPNCGRHCVPEKRARGSAIVMIFLFCLGVLPGILYAIFAGGYEVLCPHCGMKLRTELG